MKRITKLAKVVSDMTNEMICERCGKKFKVPDGLAAFLCSECQLLEDELNQPLDEERAMAARLVREKKENLLKTARTIGFGALILDHEKNEDHKDIIEKVHEDDPAFDDDDLLMTALEEGKINLEDFDGDTDLLASFEDEEDLMDENEDDLDFPADDSDLDELLYYDEEDLDLLSYDENDLDADDNYLFDDLEGDEIDDDGALSDFNRDGDEDDSLDEDISRFDDDRDEEW